MGFLGFLADMGIRMLYFILGIAVVIVGLIVMIASGMFALYYPIGFVGVVLGVVLMFVGIVTIFYSREKKSRNY